MILVEAILDGMVDINSHRLRTFLQLLGVVIGVAAIISTFSLIKGGEQQSLEFYAEIGGLRKIFVRNEPLSKIELTANERVSKGLQYDDAQKIASSCSLFTIVAPAKDGYFNVRYGDYQKWWGITGVTPGHQHVYNFFAERGRFVSDLDVTNAHRICVLGSAVKDSIFGDNTTLGKVISIGGVGYTIVGIMEEKVYRFNEISDNSLEWMNRMIFVPITAMISRMEGERTVDYINCLVRRVEDNPAASESLREVLKHQHRGVEDFYIYDRAERLAEGQKQGMVYFVTFMICGSISLLVGGIVIMNILLASFHDRVREVGIRKALGASPLAIFAQFLVESIVVTLLGGFLGLLLGIAGTRGVAALMKQPAVIQTNVVVIALSISIGVGIFFGFYPAIRASKLNPVEALRYE
jgi:putative ABC transport system permease protein